MMRFGLRGATSRRILLATLTATIAAAIVYCLAFDAWARTWPHPLFVGGMVAFIVVTWLITARLYAGPRGERWSRVRERRWILGGALVGVGEAALLMLLLIVGVADLAVHGDQTYGVATTGYPTALANACLLAVVAWLYGSALTGLPFWLLLCGVLVGPTTGSARVEAATASPDVVQR